MSRKNPTVAVLYDFDKTLSPSNMQEYGFLPAVGMTPDAFWAESERLARENGMDRILAYMYLMLQKAEGKTRITRQAFVDKGRTVELFPGLGDWFERVNAHARRAGVTTEHFIISSGLAEIIEGTPIVRQFKRIFASAFYYDLNGVARWPAYAVNFTSKTQFLFRINKGVLDLSRDDELNLYVPERDRPIPFSRMIYIGDGFSDVPCMKLVKSGGGCSIGVYAGRNKETVARLVAQGRVDFAARADYSAGKELETILFRVLELVAARYRVDALAAEKENDA
jgi:hypothetical protein